MEKIENFLMHVIEKDIASDGVQAQNETQVKEFWSWREGIPESSGGWGGVTNMMVSIPSQNYTVLVDDTRERMTRQD